MDEAQIFDELDLKMGEDRRKDGRLPKGPIQRIRTGCPIFERQRFFLPAELHVGAGVYERGPFSIDPNESL